MKFVMDAVDHAYSLLLVNISHNFYYLHTVINSKSIDIVLNFRPIRPLLIVISFYRRVIYSIHNAVILTTVQIYNSIIIVLSS